MCFWKSCCDPKHIFKLWRISSLFGVVCITSFLLLSFYYLHVSIVVQSLSHDSMDCNTPGSPVLHYLLELAQTHTHWIGDAIQSSHPLSLSSPPAINLSHHQGLFQWVSRLHQMAKYWSFSISPSKNTQDWFLLELMGLISLQSKGLSRVFFSTTVQKCQFSGAQTSLWSNSHIHTWLLYGVCIQNYITTVVRWAWNGMNVRMETADCVLCDCGKITESEEFQFGFEAVSLAWSQSINQVISWKSWFTGPFLH